MSRFTMSFGFVFALSFAGMAGAKTPEEMSAEAKVGEAMAKIIAANAAVVTAGGVADEAHAKAGMTREETVGIRLDNKAKFVKVRYDNKRANKEYRASIARPKPILRVRQGRYEQINLISLTDSAGKPKWPSILMNADFDKERDEVDKLFADRANDQDFRFKIEKITDKMFRTLAKKRPRPHTGEYASAKTFVRNLLDPTLERREQPKHFGVTKGMLVSTSRSGL